MSLADSVGSSSSWSASIHSKGILGLWGKIKVIPYIERIIDIHNFSISFNHTSIGAHAMYDWHKKMYNKILNILQTKLQVHLEREMSERDNKRG